LTTQQRIRVSNGMALVGMSSKASSVVAIWMQGGEELVVVLVLSVIGKRYVSVEKIDEKTS